MKKALENRPHFVEGVVKCTLNDTLHTVLEKIVRAEVHRIVVVDEKKVVIGMISLSDILRFLALKPIDQENPALDILAENEDRAERLRRLRRDRTIE